MLDVNTDTVMSTLWCLRVNVQQHHHHHIHIIIIIIIIIVIIIVPNI